MIYSILLDVLEGNVVFHVMANEAEKWDDYTLIVDGIELRTKDRIIDVIQSTDDVDEQ